MEFKIPRREHWNIKKYGAEEYGLSRKLSDALLKEMPGFLSSVVLFGSSARGEKTTYEKDIDILLVVNDVSIVLTPEVSETFRVVVEKTSSKISRRFHINTLKLSNFWDYLRVGDPIGINMLRDGVPLYDSGIFEPAQQLLFQGRIRPSKESVWVYYARAPNTIENAKSHVMQSLIDLYWAAIDAAHAALMRIGEIPPTPSHVPDMLTEKFVHAGLLDKKYVSTMRDLHKIAKMIAHREIQDVTGATFDRYLAETQEFIKQMKKIIETE
jgi:predicted nucleotidyltransferase/uncharacterized protein (UPF0332 family)